MSYLNKRYGSRRAMAGVDDVINTLVGGAGAALDIAGDPYLAEVVCRIAQLKQIQSGGTPASCTDTAEGLPGGVGLANFVVPLRAYVYAQQNKWVYPVAIAALIGLPVWIGYELGKG